MTLDYLVYKGSISGAGANGMVQFTGQGISEKKPNIPLFAEMPDWKRIVIQIDVKTLTGTNVTFKGKTAVDINKDLTSDSVAAKKGDGSTDFNSATITATGTYIIAMNREGASSASSNIGSVLGLLYELTSVSNLTADVFVLVTR